eukprot:g13183.t1
MAGRYQPADAAGRFNAEPRQAPREEASPYSEPFFDFDELDTERWIQLRWDKQRPSWWWLAMIRENIFIYPSIWIL